jgi:hypothetical protein
MADKANLRKFLEAWRGKSFTDEEIQNFTPDKVLGAGATLCVEHSEDGRYANIKTVSPLHKLVKLGKPYNPIVNFGIEDVGSDLFHNLYPWLQKIIMESEEFKARDSELIQKYDVPEPVKTEADDSEDIPF